MGQSKITISEVRLQEAAAQGMDEFLKVFIDRYYEEIGGELNAETMPLLSGEQITLLAYSIFRDEVMDGGFIQLIHNGYGPFIFENPFAKAMRLMGAKEFSKLVYEARGLYERYKEELTQECDDDEFMALFESHPEFDDLDDKFVDMEEQVTAILAYYVDEHIDLFGEIVKD